MTQEYFFLGAEHLKYQGNFRRIWYPDSLFIKRSDSIFNQRLQLNSQIAITIPIMDFTHYFGSGFSLPTHIQRNQGNINKILLTGHFIHSLFLRLYKLQTNAIFLSCSPYNQEHFFQFSIRLQMKNKANLDQPHEKGQLKLKDISLQHRIQQCSNIKNQLAYAKYLRALRNKQTDSSFANYSKSILMSEKQQCDLYYQPEEKFNNYQPSKLHIKCSVEEPENRVTDEMLKNSQQIDFLLSRRMQILVIKADLDKTTENIPPTFQYADQFDERIKSQLKFANEGVQSNLISSSLADKVNFLLSNEKQKTGNQVRNGNKPFLRKAQCQINFQLRIHKKQNKIFDKTQPLALLERLDESNLFSQDKKQEKKSKSVFKSASNKAQQDLKDILQKYKKKLKTFDRCKVKLTEKSQEGLFVNEFMKKAKNYQSFDILSSIIAEKPVNTYFRQSIQPEEVENKKVKLSNYELTKKCKENFSYLNKYELLKL